MPKTPFSKFALKVDGIAEPYFFISPVQKEWIESIATITGVSVAKNSDRNKPKVSVAELIRSKSADHLRVRVGSGTTAKYHTILVAASKASGAETALIDKPYGGGTIKEVVGTRKATFS